MSYHRKVALEFAKPVQFTTNLVSYVSADNKKAPAITYVAEIKQSFVAVSFWEYANAATAPAVSIAELTIIPMKSLLFLLKKGVYLLSLASAPLKRRNLSLSTHPHTDCKPVRYVARALPRAVVRWPYCRRRSGLTMAARIVTALTQIPMRLRVSSSLREFNLPSVHNRIFRSDCPSI